MHMTHIPLYTYLHIYMYNIAYIQITDWYYYSPCILHVIATYHTSVIHTRCNTHACLMFHAYIYICIYIPCYMYIYIHTLILYIYIYAYTCVHTYYIYIYTYVYVIYKYIVSTYE